MDDKNVARSPKKEKKRKENTNPHSETSAIDIKKYFIMPNPVRVPITPTGGWPFIIKCL